MPQDKGVYEGNGISVKLSAIHPRYSRAQHERVMSELLPRLKELFLLGKKIRYRYQHRRRRSQPSRIVFGLDGSFGFRP